jgi:hypothetical protein
MISNLKFGSLVEIIKIKEGKKAGFPKKTCFIYFFLRMNLFNHLKTSFYKFIKVFTFQHTIRQ